MAVFKYLSIYFILFLVAFFHSSIYAKEVYSTKNLLIREITGFSFEVEGAKMIAYPFGAIQKEAIWKGGAWSLSKDKSISVCWEDFSGVSSQNRNAIQKAIANSWSKYGNVTFINWDQCTDTSRGIRIGISNDFSSTAKLGKFLDGMKNGMILRVDYTSYPFCKNQNEFCVMAAAIHEFGHALGFAHEQLREDAPAWCRAEKGENETLPNLNITIYDQNSIMNYCNPKWNNLGELSPKDKIAVASLYGERSHILTAAEKDLLIK